MILWPPIRTCPEPTLPAIRNTTHCNSIIRLSTYFSNHPVHRLGLFDMDSITNIKTNKCTITSYSISHSSLDPGLTTDLNNKYRLHMGHGQSQHHITLICFTNSNKVQHLLATPAMHTP
ncbi:hypothetical protein LPJ66_003448 [Kickxella alabastrina]|uniref:Uncharacterized protein n=1 Tax=Kickxella alabastrina TaxID=61397 RepID=A0ACC1IM69_9FUNG|nr:hypothetical protein LPJ66_003448 [Kickxella alabastrina]